MGHSRAGQHGLGAGLRVLLELQTHSGAWMAHGAGTDPVGKAMPQTKSPDGQVSL